MNFQVARKGVVVLLSGFLAFFVALFLFPPAGILDANSSDETSDKNISNRSTLEIRLDLLAFVKRSREAKTNDELADSVLDMCRLHHEIVNHGKFQQSKVLQGYRGQLWQRLKTVKNKIKQDMARRERQIKKELRSQGMSAKDIKEWNRNSENVEPSSGDFNDLADRISQQMTLANQMTGGPSQVFAYASGRWAGPPDNGPALVRLIEETINPEFWERNGGPGRIHYYKPLRILVVTGTIEVQDDLQKMLRTLRMISR